MKGFRVYRALTLEFRVFVLHLRVWFWVRPLRAISTTGTAWIKRGQETAAHLSYTSYALRLRV